MTTYADLIKQWFERAQKEEEYFTKFIFLYISFIAFLTQRYNGRNDRGKIESLKKELEAREFYLKLLAKEEGLRKLLIELIGELNRKPIVNVTRGPDQWWQGTDGELRDEKDWENLVEYWYRVRNNLFHGHKAPGFERDRKLVTYAYKTLYPLMKNFVDHDLL
jgi:hypothetical protein